MGRALSVIVSPIFVSATTLMFAMMKPTSPADRHSTSFIFGVSDADRIDGINLAVRHQADLHALADLAVDHANHDDHAAIGIEPGIEEQRLQRRIGIALRRRDSHARWLRALLRRRVPIWR